MKQDHEQEHDYELASPLITSAFLRHLFFIGVYSCPFVVKTKISVDTFHAFR